MTIQTIGHLTLNLSFCLYCIYFLPQILHNRKNNNRHQLSLGLHMLYILGFCADWIYAVGQQMPWQYKTVTAIGLVMMLVQHYQLRPNKTTPHSHKSAYYALTILALMLYAFTVNASTNSHILTRHDLDLVGLLSTICFTCTFFPQILKNYRTRTACGLSNTFIKLTLLVASIDFVSALCLNWPWPSLLSPILLFAIHLGCLSQQHYFQRMAKRSSAAI